MLFNSMHFLLFFPIVTFIYFFIPHKFRYIWLLITSYYFYMSWNPKYALLICISTIITYLSGILIEKSNKITDKQKSKFFKKLWVFLSLFINLSILFLFKYCNFFTYTFTKIFSLINITIKVPSFDFILPVGISFYTFQALSYTIDVYRGNIKFEKNLGKYALFVSFFPQLVAGPIEKSKDLLNQFNEKHIFDYNRVKNGLVLMLWGFFQKVFVSDRLAILVDTVFNTPSNYKGLEIIVASVFFAIQIYCDFSSYSNIARGAAEVMGFDLSLNFKQPYFSKSIQEFWRRWHITLGAWFKDYLYIPLGGNKCSKWRRYFNNMVVFLISGLWHGAAINFIIWGGLHGFYIIIGDMLKPLKEKIINNLKIKTNVFSFKLFQTLFTFILVDFSWIFFRANSFSEAKLLIKNMFYFNPWIFTSNSIYNLGLDQNDFKMSILGILIVFIIDSIARNKDIRVELSNQNIVFRWAIYLSAIFFVLILGIYGAGYDANQFIYFQF
ncbi:MBOAT family protein [Clostridium botulinum]|uniref:MBOAT family O-acyltransferase n=1 Tax=Clostridium botulinum TaxID=1491 RepID=UPI00174B8CFF|nr:MBOAT family O-acyltransferase [Clostridium botulinum]MBD5644395.1 MBOAT family protein [Clostridium botulinum]